MVQETSDVVTVEKNRITTADEVMTGILREIGLVQVEQETAAIIDLWSALLSIQLDDVPEEARKSIMRDNKDRGGDT